MKLALIPALIAFATPALAHGNDHIHPHGFETVSVALLVMAAVFFLVRR